MKLLQKPIIKLCLLLLYTASSSVGMVFKSSDRTHGELIPLSSVRELVARKTTFTRIPVSIFNFTGEAFMYIEKRDTKGVIAHVNSHEGQRNLIQEDMGAAGCSWRYSPDTQGCVWCVRSAKCAAGWEYYKYNMCGFGGCQSICKQAYNCPTPAPTGSPTTLAPTDHPTTHPTPSPTVPTPAPTMLPTAAPTFTDFSLPIEVPMKKTSFDNVYVINEFNGLVIEYKPEGFSMDWIKSGQDIDTKEEDANHPQIWNYDSSGHMSSAQNPKIRLYINEDAQLVAGWPCSACDVAVIHYNTITRTLLIEGVSKILCIENNKPALCEENSNSPTTRWKFKTREEAFPHDFGIIGEYYIVSKDTDLVIEQRTHVSGFPLMTWIPDGSIGQLWHHDSYGRILNRLGEFIEAVDVFVIKYTIPNLKPGSKYTVPGWEGPLEIVMTREAYRYVNQVTYIMTDHKVPPTKFMSTSSKQEDDPGQQWHLVGGQLINGHDNRKLALKPLLDEQIKIPMTFMGQECELVNEVKDQFYLVPSSMIVSWIDVVSLKNFDLPYALEEALYYQRTAAYHINSIIGLSPEELVSRSHFHVGFIEEAVHEWKKAGKAAAVGGIVGNATAFAGSVLNIVGFALSGVTFGGSAIYMAIGSALSLSAYSVDNINMMNKQAQDKAGKNALKILEEIQKTVLSGSNALASFLDDYQGAMRRLDDFYASNEGQKQLRIMEQEKQAFAEKIGYADFASFYTDLVGGSTFLSDLMRNLVWIPLAQGTYISSFRTLLLHHSYTSAPRVPQGPTTFGGLSAIVDAVYALYYGAGLYTSIKKLQKLHGDDNLGDELVRNCHVIDDTIKDMVNQLNLLAGDVEDVKTIYALTSRQDMLFTDDRWRTLDVEGEFPGLLESPVYGQIFDARWYEGCSHIPC